MALTVYEKNNVQSGKSCIVMGKMIFNVLNKPRTQKPNQYIAYPKPEYVIALENVEYVKGDENLIKALEETQYGEHNDTLSLRDKSPFAPTIFGSDKKHKTGDELIPDGSCLANGQQVLVHVTTYKGRGNVGCGFDAVKLTTPLDKAEISETGGSVSADVFDL